MIGLGQNIHFNALIQMLTGRHKQINQPQTRKCIQWGAGKNKSRDRQDTGNMCTDPETTGRAQRQKQAMKGTDELILGRGGGNEGQVKHIRTGHTGNTRTDWKWSHSDQSRGECFTTTGSYYECVTWGEDKHALRIGASYDTIPDHLWCSRSFTQSPWVSSNPEVS